ncbi:chitinase [Noviherbaspirillum sp. ST9]|uniref:chitinase n=1 Tax=Noviherbaspirillum sp. ST9 TaxID=3401606 RepID=UPI003B5861FB
MKMVRKLAAALCVSGVLSACGGGDAKDLWVQIGGTPGAISGAGQTTVPPVTTPTVPAPVVEPGFIVTEAQFNQIFPNRASFYTYAGLVDAVKAFPEFAGSGDRPVRLREAAAFLAQVMHESGGLRYVTELNQANWPLYCLASVQYPCAPGKQYYGRGPLQISWNYNYATAGAAFGVDLLNNPDLVETDAATAWKTALWFWMTSVGAGTMTGHAAMVNNAGFGETTRSINGALECGKAAGSDGYLKMQMRVTYYLDIARLLGVDAGGNLTC